MAEAFRREGISATSVINTAEQIRFAGIYRLVNKVADAAFDSDLYESVGEERPSPSAIVAAVEALASVSFQEANNVQIEPYPGEVGLVWKSGRNKRVKAMFGPEPHSYSVYYEQMVNGHVVDHHLEPHIEPSNHDYLKQRLAWLRT